MLALVFPGQGSQSATLDSFLRSAAPSVRFPIDCANEICHRDVLLDLADPNPRTDRVQPAIVAAIAALLNLLQERCETDPVFLAGHSLGEWVALIAAKALSIESALTCVAERGRIMAARCRSTDGMVAVTGLSPARFMRLRRDSEQPLDGIEVACLNAPESLTIAGPEPALTAAATEIRRIGGTATAIPVTGAFHTTLFRDAAHEFRAVVVAAAWRPLARSVIGNASGYFYPADRDRWPDLLCNQLFQPVQWDRTIKLMQASGVTHVLEVGPKPILAQLITATRPSLKVLSFCRPDQLASVDAFLKSVPAHSRNVALLGRALGIIACCGVEEGASHCTAADFRTMCELHQSCLLNDHAVPQPVIQQAIELCIRAMRAAAVSESTIARQLLDLSRLASNGIRGTLCQAADQAAIDHPASGFPDIRTIDRQDFEPSGASRGNSDVARAKWGGHCHVS